MPSPVIRRAAPLAALALLTAALAVSAALHPSHAADSTSIFDTHFAKVQNGAPCYARAYDDAHLKAHPNQRIRRIEFDMAVKNPDGNPNGAENFELGFGVMTAVSPDWYTGSAICKAAGEAADCFLEGDGGRFRLTPDKGGALKLEAGEYGLAFEGAKDTLEISATDSDDKVFILAPSDRAECEAATADVKSPEE
jgi:hypothetical protein